VGAGVPAQGGTLACGPGGAARDPGFSPWAGRAGRRGRVQPASWAGRGSAP